MTIAGLYRICVLILFEWHNDLLIYHAVYLNLTQKFTFYICLHDLLSVRVTEALLFSPLTLVRLLLCEKPLAYSSTPNLGSWATYHSKTWFLVTSCWDANTPKISALTRHPLRYLKVTSDSLGLWIIRIQNSISIYTSINWRDLI